jgi:hypothetical protein
VTDQDSLVDSLVPDWLTLPDLAEALNIEVKAARRIIQERLVVGIRRGERTTFQVPAAFVVAAHLANPSNVEAPVEDAAAPRALLTSLQGTIAVLTDNAFSDEQIIEWLFTPNESLRATPLDALLAGRKAEVRRIAQVDR